MVRILGLMLTGVAGLAVVGCPFVTPNDGVVRGQGFTIELPENTQITGGGLSLAGTLTQVVYRGPDGELYYILTVDGSTGLEQLPAGAEAVRYTGTSVTDTDDVLARGLVATDGDPLRIARTGLSGGRQLYVATDAPQPEPAFRGIEVTGGDGTSLAALLEAASGSLLETPITTTEVSGGGEVRVVVLADLSAFALLDEESDSPAGNWAVGDALVVHAAGSLADEVGAQFITRIGDYRSAPAAALGTGRRVTLSDVTLDGAIVRVTLSDGDTLTVIGNGEEEAAGWSNGDELIRLDNVAAFFDRTVLVRVRTGRLVVVAE